MFQDGSNNTPISSKIVMVHHSQKHNSTDYEIMFAKLVQQQCKHAKHCHTQHQQNESRTLDWLTHLIIEIATMLHCTQTSIDQNSNLTNQAHALFVSTSTNSNSCNPLFKVLFTFPSWYLLSVSSRPMLHF